MTIIEPNKNKYKINSLFFTLVIVLVTLATFNIYFYNRNVNLKHSINNYQKELQEQRVTNADYKNQFYQILDSEKIELLAKEKGLIQEKNPKYFEA